MSRFAQEFPFPKEVDRKRCLLTTLLVLSAVTAPFAAASAQDAASPTPDQATWLLVLHGDVAGITEGELVLVADPRVIAFTDRPERQVRLLETSAFVAEFWAEGSSFRQDVPNALLADDDSHGSAVITIDNGGQQGRVLTLEYGLLEGEMPEVGDYAILTIDGVPGIWNKSGPNQRIGFG